MDGKNKDQACIRRPRQEMLQDHSYGDRMHHNQNQGMHDSSPISTEDYLRNEVMKGIKQQTDNKVNKLTEKFGKIHSDAQLNRMEMERKDTEPKVIE